MKILKVYDTMQRAKFEAEEYYRDWLSCGMDVRYRTPYRLEVGKNVYMFVGRQATLRGLRFDRIDDCTTCGIPNKIMMCVKEG